LRAEEKKGKEKGLREGKDAKRSAGLVKGWFKSAGLSPRKRVRVSFRKEGVYRRRGGA